MKTAGDVPVTAAPRRGGVALRVLAIFAGTLLALLALPVCLLLGVSVTGWAIGAGLVLVNSILHAIVAYAVRNASVTVTLGAMGFSMLFRAGLTALVFFFIGAELSGAPGDRAVGLDRPDLARVAIVVFLIGFSLDALVDTLRRAAQRDTLTRSSSSTTAPETTA